MIFLCALQKEKKLKTPACMCARQRDQIQMCLVVSTSSYSKLTGTTVAKKSINSLGLHDIFIYTCACACACACGPFLYFIHGLWGPAIYLSGTLDNRGQIFLSAEFVCFQTQKFGEIKNTKPQHICFLNILFYWVVHQKKKR